MKGLHIALEPAERGGGKSKGCEPEFINVLEAIAMISFMATYKSGPKNFNEAIVRKNELDV